MSNTKKELTKQQIENRKKYGIYQGKKGKNSRYFFGLHDFISKNHKDISLKAMGNMFGIYRSVVGKYYKELGLFKYNIYKKQPFDITINLPKPLDRYFVTNHAQVVNKETNVILKPKVSNHGYYVYELAGTDGKLYYKLQHRLFAWAFIPNPLNKKEINHIYGDKLLNMVFTLEWVTREENMRHFHEILMKDDINIPGNAKIDKELAYYIVKMIDNGSSYKEVSSKYPMVTKYMYKNIKWSNSWSKVRD